MPKDETLEAKLKRLRLFGLLARADEVRKEPWLDRVLAIEEEEKTRRSLTHRVHLAGIHAFKPLADFDWKWPRKIDRAQIEDLYTLDFIAEGANVVVLGPNGVGKTMLLRNIAHRALHDGRAVVVRSASDLLADLVKQESSAARARRLAAYVLPHLLCIDEVGYLSYDARHADLLFEVVSRRYDKGRSILLTTNKPFPADAEEFDESTAAANARREVERLQRGIERRLLRAPELLSDLARVRQVEHLLRHPAPFKRPVDLELSGKGVPPLETEPVDAKEVAEPIDGLVALTKVWLIADHVDPPMDLLPRRRIGRKLEGAVRHDPPVASAADVCAARRGVDGDEGDVVEFRRASFCFATNASTARMTFATSCSRRAPRVRWIHEVALEPGGRQSRSDPLTCRYRRGRRASAA